MALRVVSAILFSPRGGSAHVAKALARGLRERGCDVTLLAGSRSDSGGHGDARVFYGEVHAVDFGPALASEAPLCYEGPPGTAPLHPSFEDRPGAPDKAFARLDDVDFERQVRTWSRELEAVGAQQADVLHLHHLTPLNEAAARVAPEVPIVGQLHGTELLMLEQIASGASDRSGDGAGKWPYARSWQKRMRSWAQRCSRLAAAPGGVQRAADLLEVSPERLCPLPNGVDPSRFHPRPLDRAAFWRRVLVEQPRGWLPGQDAGSAGYQPEEIQRLGEGVVLVYVGRFTAVKRLDRLIGAFAQAQQRSSKPAGLVLVGGHPGEWEGEHPAEVAWRLGARGVFLAGWYDHDDLPPFLCAADAVVLASEREQFGQVLIEGMACGLPAIATRSLGPDSIVRDRATGWLVQRSEEALADALVEVIEDASERRRRGRVARREACERYSWPSVAARLATLLEDAARHPGRETMPAR